MTWQAIDTQLDLDKLDKAISWSHSRSLEYLSKFSSETYFPSDVSLSGYDYPNLHVICKVDSKLGNFLELVFISCDTLGLNALYHLHLGGRVDTLKRVEIVDHDKSTRIRAARLMYRFLEKIDINPESIEGSYFKSASSIK